MTEPLPGAPSWSVSPIDENAHPEDQRYQALTFADDNGWLAFENVTPGRPAERRYVIEVNGHPRVLRPDAVLPYVMGLADARGVGHALFGNREDTPPS